MRVYTIPYQDGYIVSRPRLRLAFVANAAMVNMIAALDQPPAAHDHGDDGDDGDARRFLREIGFLQPDPPPPETPSPDAPYRPTVAVLLLTTRCNFRCTYCYAMAGETSGRVLPFELACRGIDAVARNAAELGEDHFTVVFHGGGEPTLARETLRRGVDHARGKDLPTRLRLTSNGYWSPQLRSWILDHLDSVSLSFDGLRELQDRQRVLVSGRGTYDVVMASIREMDRRSFPYGIRMPATDDGIDLLPRSVEHLCGETGCGIFQVEPATDEGRARRGGLALSRRQRFVDAFLEAYDIAATAGRHLYYSGARPWVVTSRFCGAAEKALVVTAEGGLSACYEVFDEGHELAGDFVFGSLDPDGPQLRAAARASLYAKIETRRAECERCFCYWHCAGDCPARTVGSPDERCELNRELTKELLVRLIAAGGGVWRAEPPIREEAYPN